MRKLISLKTVGKLCCIVLVLSSIYMYTSRMLCIDGERKRQGWLCLHVARGQSWGRNASLDTYIPKNRASCTTRWARSARQ